MPIYALGAIEPTIDSTAYVHPDAVIIGSVTIGPESSVWPHAVLRGDDGEIRVGARTSIQDCTVLHTTVEDPIVAANAVVLYDVDVPPGALAVGAPATIKPDRARMEEITRGVSTYVARAE